MKDFTILDERMDALFDAAERGPGGTNGQFYQNVLEAQREIYNTNDRARKRGYTADWENIYQIPTPVFNRKNVMRLKIGWLCPEGHTTKMNLTKANAVFDDMDKVPCGFCRRNLALVSGHSMHTLGRVRMVMQHDERGEDMLLDTYSDSTTAYMYQCRTTGMADTTYMQNLHLWTRRQHTREDKRVYIAEDGEYAFLWTGPRPIVHHPVIKDLLERADARTGDAIIEPYYDPDFQTKKGYTQRKGLENAIVEAGDLGAKVLNIGLNPQYIAPGSYTWGNLAEENAALAEYIENIHKEWVAHLECHHDAT